MSTAIISAPIRRFAWKEYRALRGLWLAVLILGMLVDWLSGVLLGPGTDWPTVRLCVALASATLYAAGAAAILFAMEHEEQTYEFLRGLPMTWLPIFVGKLLLATLSAIGLASVLSFVGLMPGGFRLPTGTNASLAFGIFGLAILEAIAWGTLCSLLIKRPLAAAIMTLVVGALAVHLAVNAVNSAAVASTDPKSYVTAIPLRLVIVVTVLGMCIAVARNWLVTGSSGGAAGALPSLRWFAAVRAPLGRAWGAVAICSDRRRTSMLARLMWQTWRESWKLLLLPIVVAAVCVAVAMILQRMRTWAGGLDPGGWVAIATIFFAPALFGALAFSADQRRGHVRFLAEHAAAPRYVWLSRHIVWLGTLAVVAALVALAVTTLVVTGLLYRTQEYHSYEREFYSDPKLRRELREFLLNATSATALGWWGILTAYSIGQICSMLLRSEILAAFLALVLAVVLSAWVSVLFLWQLSAWLFLLPLAAGLLLATWLRAPDWVAGRNNWRAWLKPALAVVGALAVLGLSLPGERIAQIRRAPRPMPGQSGQAAATPEAAAFLKRWTAEAEATAEMYLKAAAMLLTPVADSPLAPWSGPEYAEKTDLGPGGIDESRIPPEQKEAFQAAKKKLEEQLKQQHDEAIKLAIQASQRPTCRFSFPLSAADFRFNNRFDNSWMKPGKTYDDLNALLDSLVSFTADGGESDIPLEQLLAALRMSTHLQSGQPTVIFIRQLKREQEILKRIGGWAAVIDRTNEERRAAIAKLQERFRSPPDLANSLLADGRLIRDVITGKELPFVLSQQPIPTFTYLAFLANELSWERERALEALDVITNQNLKDAYNLADFISRTTTHDSGHNALRRWVRPDYEPAAWMAQQPAAVTSYLVSLEYNARVQVNELLRQYCDTRTIQQAVLIEIALAMYRHDHNEYPATLAALVPDYLDREPLDPYSMQPFSYMPHGLDKPLRLFGHSGQVEVATHTPMFWSVGPNDVRLHRRDYDDLQTDEEHPEADLIRKTGTFFALDPVESWSVYAPTDLVFRLPK